MLDHLSKNPFCSALGYLLTTTVYSNRTTSPSLGDEGDSQRAEQDAVNEVDGLIVGLDILDELEGDGMLLFVTLIIDKTR